MWHNGSATPVLVKLEVLNVEMLHGMLNATVNSSAVLLATLIRRSVLDNRGHPWV